MRTATFIIPAFNARETLPETIAALAAQTRRDWSAIIVDDGSKDGTAEFARSLLSDPRIRLVCKSNGGVSSARNLGARLAESFWLVFLDADDLIAPDYLARMLEQAEALSPGDTAVVFCSGRRLGADGRLGQIDTPPARDQAIHLRSGNIFYTHAVIVPRTLFWSLGGFDERLTTCEDWEFWVRLFASNPSVHPVKEPLAIYRLRPGSLTKNIQSLFDEASAVVRFAYGEVQNQDGIQLAIESALVKEMEMSLFLVRLWVCGVSAGTGNFDIAILSRLHWPQGLAPQLAAKFFVTGFTHGACRLISDWTAIWDETSPDVRNYIRVASESDRLPAEWESCLQHIAEFAVSPNVADLGQDDRSGARKCS